MCTLVILRRPDHDWPVVVGANRDEMRGRPWRPPGRHWPDRDHVVAGLDEEAGGTWLGINDDGLVAGVLNRRGSLGPAAGKRSRGELPLEALDHAEAAEAARALTDIDPAAYRTFNLIVADARDAFWLRSVNGADPVEAFPISEGLSMITASDLDDVAGSARVRRHLPRFRSAPPPDPDGGDWMAWEALLADRSHDPDAGPGGAMNVDHGTGFATVSSSLLALPGPNRFGTPPIWRFRAGPPLAGEFDPVDVVSPPAA